jgi:hypothetical protein
MKKIMILSTLNLFLLLNASGQVLKPYMKGNYFIGGIIDLNIKTYHFQNDNILLSNKVTSLELSPDFAYFIYNRFSLGLQFNYQFSVEKYLADGSKSKFNTFIITPIIRYYFFQDIFSELGVGYGLTKANNDNYNIIQAKIDIGYSIFLRDKIALEPIISYIRTSERSKEISEYKLNNMDFNLSIGLRTFF